MIAVEEHFSLNKDLPQNQKKEIYTFGLLDGLTVIMDYHLNRKNIS